MTQYLKTNPNLRSVIIDSNPFSDDGLLRLARVLRTNTKLAHISFKKCTNLTDEGLEKLLDVI